MVTKAKRIILIAIGICSLALGGLGIVLPLLPTTPFVLVAAVAFANSSDRLHQWLLDHNLFGPLIRNWRRHGAISPFAKALSIGAMAAVLAISMLLAAPTLVIVTQALVLGACALFVVSRPLPPDQ